MRPQRGVGFALEMGKKEIKGEEGREGARRYILVQSWCKKYKLEKEKDAMYEHLFIYFLWIYFYMHYKIT